MRTIKRPKTVEQQAKEAGVEDLYTVFYRFMSLETHGHQIESMDTDPETLCITHLQGIGGLANAIGHIGVYWLLHRTAPSNESLREQLGLT